VSEEKTTLIPSNNNNENLIKYLTFTNSQM